MDGSIVLGRGQRNRLLDLYRKDPSPCVRLRAHIILLRSEGHPWTLIGAVLFCSSATIARWKQRFEAGGVEALLVEERGRRSALAVWAVLLVTWVKTLTPRDFGYCRSPAAGSSCTACRRTRRRTTLSSGCGGTCASRSPVPPVRQHRGAGRPRARLAGGARTVQNRRRRLKAKAKAA